MNADDLAQLLASQFGWDTFPLAEDIAVWVGHKFLHATGRDPNADDLFYNVKDLRRAVAYVRVTALVGFGTGKIAAKMHDRVREMAAWHASGYIVVTRVDTVFDPFIDWADSASVPLLDFTGSSVLVVPCEVDGIGSAV